MTVTARQVVDAGAKRLRNAGVPEADIKMEWWVAEALAVRRDRLDSVMPDAEKLAMIESGVARLLQHEPLQHVIGHVPFLDVNLFVDDRALVPRPETEELVSRISETLQGRGDEISRVADVGCGTGCIALALAKRHPTMHVYAIDNSADALALARKNAAANDLEARVTLIKGDLLAEIPPGILDVVVSNPPYIASAEIAGLDASVREFEPLAALDGGPDGLVIIRRLVEQAFTSLKNDGRLWLEIGDEQGEAVRDIMENAGFADVEINCDMYGKTRFASGLKCCRS
ncbi:MAG TPA: peptide chain release factor N(5)-glutamine methyltransferase [Kiritimatiellia bacterium]|nr:peptide chain release factor N(5)-glutamine methyltransferase [Kiritimatiellia bacterium]